MEAILEMSPETVLVCFFSQNPNLAACNVTKIIGWHFQEYQFDFMNFCMHREETHSEQGLMGEFPSSLWSWQPLLPHPALECYLFACLFYSQKLYQDALSIKQKNMKQQTNARLGRFPYISVKQQKANITSLLNEVKLLKKHIFTNRTVEVDAIM